MMVDNSNHAPAAPVSAVCPFWCRLRTQQDREGDSGWLVVARPGGVPPLPVGDEDTDKLYLHFNGPRSQYCYYTLDFSRDGQHHHIGVAFDEDQKHWVHFGIVQEVLGTMAVAFQITDYYKNSFGSTSALPSLTATDGAPNTSSPLSPTGEAAAAPPAAPDWPSRPEEFIGRDHGLVVGEQHRSCATNTSNQVPPVKEFAPKSVSDTNCYDTAYVHGLNFPSDPQETPHGKAGGIFGRSRSRHADEDDRMALHDHDGESVQHVRQIQEAFEDWCFQPSNHQDDNYVECANRDSKTAAPKAAAESTANLGQLKKSQDRDIGHVVFQGIQHVVGTQNVHNDEYSGTTDLYSKMAISKAIAQSAIGLGQSGRSLIDEEGSDCPSSEQGGPRPIPTDPKKRVPKSNDKHIVPSGEMKESSLHSSARKRVRFSNGDYTLETDQLDRENPDCEHNIIKGSKAKLRKHRTSSGPVMGTFKTPWQMSRDAEAKKQAKASKRTGTNKQAPAIGRSAGRGIPTPAAHAQPAESGSGMSKKRKIAAEKHGSRKRAAPTSSSELVLSHNDEPEEPLPLTQKAPKKSIPKSSESTLTTPAVARAARTCGRLYANEAEALAEETDADSDLKEDEVENEKPPPIMSTAEYNAFSGISCSVKKDQKAYMSVWKLM
ncbi:MAG: hypothetical protein Q9205_006963 [Flavoplaca limonia]